MTQPLTLHALLGTCAQIALEHYGAAPERIGPDTEHAVLACRDLSPRERLELIAELAAGLTERGELVIRGPGAVDLVLALGGAPGVWVYAPGAVAAFPYAVEWADGKIGVLQVSGRRPPRRATAEEIAAHLPPSKDGGAP